MIKSRLKAQGARHQNFELRIANFEFLALYNLSAGCLLPAGD